MAKGNGGTRVSWATRNNFLSLIGGNSDPELTDSIRDYFLPQSVRDELSQISELKTFAQLQDFFKERGITLISGSDDLNNNRRNEYLRPVAEAGQKLAVAVETYSAVFGNKSIRKLKSIVLGDTTVEANTAAYYYNEPGENDPNAGTLRIRGYSPDGYVVFHELAHAYQDSQRRSGETMSTAVKRIMTKAKLDSSFKAYFGAETSAAGIDAERFADAFGYGFARGSKTGLDFIDKVRKYKK